MKLLNSKIETYNDKSNILNSIHYSFEFGIQDCDKYLRWLQIWDLGVKLNMINDRLPDTIDKLGQKLKGIQYSVPNEGLVPVDKYLQRFIDNPEAGDRSVIIQQLMQWIVDKSDCKFDLVYSKDGIDIIHPLDKITYIKYGFGTRWCTSIPSLQSGVLETREVKLLNFESSKIELINSCADYPDACIILINDKPAYQYDTESNQFMNAADESVGYFSTVEYSSSEIEETIVKACNNLVGYAMDFKGSDMIRDDIDWNCLTDCFFTALGCQYPSLIAQYYIDPNDGNNRNLVVSFRGNGEPVNPKIIQAFKDMNMYDKPITECIDYSLVLHNLYLHRNQYFPIYI